MKNTNNKGFTLVELVVVIAVIAILAGVLIGTFATVSSSANLSKELQEWKAIADEAYLEYVSQYNAEPGAVKVDQTNKTMEFVQSGTAGAYDLTKSTSSATYYIELEKMANTNNAVFLVVLQSGLRVVTGTSVTENNTTTVTISGYSNLTPETANANQ